MGNCQAAEAATVVIQHPGNKVERIFWSVSAHDVMSSNPGYYVALLLTSPTHNATTHVRQLKLLRPADTLLLGQVYRLISFEDVLKEFAAKKCVKLGKLLKESGGLVNGIPVKMEHETYHQGNSSGQRSVGRHNGGGQWKPALQSIAELGN